MTTGGYAPQCDAQQSHQCRSAGASILVFSTGNCSMTHHNALLLDHFRVAAMHSRHSRQGPLNTHLCCCMVCFSSCATAACTACSVMVPACLCHMSAVNTSGDIVTASYLLSFGTRGHVCHNAHVVVGAKTHRVCVHVCVLAVVRLVDSRTYPQLFQ